MGWLIVAVPSRSVTFVTSNQFTKSEEVSMRQARPLSPTRIRMMLPFCPKGVRKWKGGLADHLRYRQTCHCVGISQREYAIRRHHDGEGAVVDRQVGP